MAPPMPNVPVPLVQVQEVPQPDEPMPNTNENQALTLEGVQGAIETATGYAPSSMVLSFAAGAIAMLALLLGMQKVMRDRKMNSPTRCKYCFGTGEEPKEITEACAECEGAGQVEDENEPATECKHCEGEGEDPCHLCKGSGKDAAGQECPDCKGGGKTLTGKQDEDGEDEVADCEICNGEGEVSATIKRMLACEKCGGTGKV